MSFTGSLIIPGDLTVDGSFNVLNAVSSVGNVTTYGKTNVDEGSVFAVLTTLNGLSGAVGLTGSDGIAINAGGTLIEIDGTSLGGSYWPNGPATADMDLGGYLLTSAGGTVFISGNLVVNNNIVDTAVAYEYTSNTTFQPPFVPCRLVYSIIGGGGGGGPGGQAFNLSFGGSCSGGGGSSGVCVTGTVILTSSAVITLSCGVGGSGGVYLFAQDQVGSNGTATILFSSNFYDYALGGYGGGPGKNIPSGSAGLMYGGGGAGVGQAGGTQNGGNGIALASNQYRGLAAAGGGGGQDMAAGFGGGGAGYATNGITPSGGIAGSPGNGEFLFAHWDGAGDVGGTGGNNTRGTSNFSYGGGGGGIRCVAVSTGGNGGSPAYDTGAAIVIALNGCDGVAGGGGGGGGGGYDDVAGVGRATGGADGGRGGDGAGRFVFTSLLNPVTAYP